MRDEKHAGDDHERDDHERDDHERDDHERDDRGRDDREGGREGPSPDDESRSWSRIDDLIGRRHTWLLEKVRRRLGTKLRVRVDSNDILQEALLRFLSYRSKLPGLTEEDFCKLMCRIVENSIRDQWAFFWAQRRSVDRELGPEASEEELRKLSDGGSTPSRVLTYDEDMNLTTFVLGLLAPIDRRIVVLRIHGVPFKEIARDVGISDVAAMSRHRRARKKLLELRERVQRGSIGGIDWDAVDRYCLDGGGVKRSGLSKPDDSDERGLEGGDDFDDPLSSAPCPA